MDSRTLQELKAFKDFNKTYEFKQKEIVLAEAIECLKQLGYL